MREPLPVRIISGSGCVVRRWGERRSDRKGEKSESPLAGCGACPSFDWFPFSSARGQPVVEEWSVKPTLGLYLFPPAEASTLRARVCYSYLIDYTMDLL